MRIAQRRALSASSGRAAAAIAILSLCACAHNKPASSPPTTPDSPKTAAPTSPPPQTAEAPPPSPSPTPSPAQYSQTAPPTSDLPLPTSDFKEVFPHIQLNASTHTLELDSTVPIDAHNEKTPRVYLEVCACIPDSKEHETLVVTKARPSNVHAALLLAGLQPGKPGVWDWSGEKLKATPPTGDAVTITLIYKKDGKDIEDPITDWVIDADTHKTMTQTAAANAGQDPATLDHFVFAGSTIVKHQSREGYSADFEGTLIGLTTFGGETIAWTRMYNPDSGVETPHWIANAAKVPEVGTPVTVRIHAAQ